MSKHPTEEVAPARRTVPPQGGTRRTERRRAARPERNPERPPPGWTGPYIPYPPPPPPPLGERVVIGLRKYGLLALAAVIVLGVAVWWLVGDTTEPAFGPDSEVWQQVAGVSAPVEEAADVPVRLSVVTRPAGAEVRLDFDSVGVTPLDGHTVAAGTYLLSVAKDGYLTYDTLLTVAPGERSALNVALQVWGEDVARAPAQVREQVPAPPARGTRPERDATPAVARGELRVTSQPPRATVWLDGRRVGTTPLALEGVAAGPHAVKVRGESGQTYVEDVEVEPGTPTTVRAEFTPAVGRLTVLVQPWGSIYIDGQLHRQETDVQYEVELPAGTHRLRVEHPALGSVTQEVTVAPGAPQRIVIDLNARGE
jgi:hypothetical protein